MSSTLPVPLPPGFVLLREGRRVAVVRESLASDVRRARLLEPGGWESLFAGAAGSAGRARTAIWEPGSDARVVLRRVLHGGWLGPGLGPVLLGLGRPLRELAVTEALADAGAPVPRPALVLGERRAGPFWTAVVGTRLEPGTVDGLAFLETRPAPPVLAAVARAAGRAVRRFHDAGGRHADLHVKNLLVRNAEGEPEVLVVDLDRAGREASVSPRARMHELMRLYRSLWKRGQLETVGRRGCAAFFGSYVGGDRKLRRALLAARPREMRRVRRHALLYRSRGRSVPG